LSKLQVAQGHPGSSRARAREREREREREIARVAHSGEIFFRVFRDFSDAFGGEFSRSLPQFTAARDDNISVTRARNIADIPRSVIVHTARVFRGFSRQIYRNARGIERAECLLLRLGGG